MDKKKVQSILVVIFLFVIMTSLFFGSVEDKKIKYPLFALNLLLLVIFYFLHSRYKLEDKK